jgi:hypothetical protein
MLTCHLSDLGVGVWRRSLLDKTSRRVICHRVGVRWVVVEPITMRPMDAESMHICPEDYRVHHRSTLVTATDHHHR